MIGLVSTQIVGVIGAGAMGAGIAQVAAQAGHRVIIFDAAPGTAARAVASIRSRLAREVGEGRSDEQQGFSIASLIEAASNMEELTSAELVIEAIVEKADVKRTVFAALENIVSDGTIIATNTSSFSITAIAAGMKHPGRFAGMHFFNPAPVMRLVEIIGGLQTHPSTLHTLTALAKAWGKRPVLASSTPGFIVNRVARPFYAEGLRMLEEGVSDPATIDTIMRQAGGFRMGPFELMDLIGHDVNLAVTKSVFEAYFGDPRYRPSLIQQELVAAGWLGRKTDRGFYQYGAGLVRPTIKDAPKAAKPLSVIVEGSLGPANVLPSLMQSAGIAIEHREGSGLIKVEGATIALSDGRTATIRGAQENLADLVLLDLAFDFSETSRIVLASSTTAPPIAMEAASGLFQALSKSVSVVADSPGLIVLRTLAMLANEASEALHCGVASAADIDDAMVYGTNYPIGPLAWADKVSSCYILGALEGLHDAYGDDRYRPSLALRQSAASGSKLRDGGHLGWSAALRG